MNAGKSNEMNREQHTAEQINAKLRHAEMGPIHDGRGALAWGQRGAHAQAYSPRVRTVSDMEDDPVERLKELERENGRLKKLVAEQALDIDVLKERNRFFDASGC